MGLASSFIKTLVSCSISILLRQLEREICIGGHYPSCPLDAGICSLLNSGDFLSSDEPGKSLRPPTSTAAATRSKHHDGTKARVDDRVGRPRSDRTASLALGQ